MLYGDFVEGPAGMCPVQGVFDIERDGQEFRGYFRSRGTTASVDLWLRGEWGDSTQDLPDAAETWSCWVDLPVEQYMAGYIHHLTAQDITAWALAKWAEGHPGGDLGALPDTIKIRMHNED